MQSQPDQDLNVSAKVDAGEISDWIKIENGNNFVIPKGTQQFPMKVDVNVPSNAELKNYTGTITLTTSTSGSQKSGVSIVLGAEVKIDLTVGSIQVSDFSIQNFQLPNVEKGSPINFVIKVKNQGNVDNGPTKVSLTYFDQYHNTQLGQQDEDIVEKAPSFQTKDISVAFPNKLDVGEYWADVKIYNADKVVVDSKLIFNILPIAGGKEQSKSFAISLPNLSSIPFWVYILAGAILVIVILIIVIFVILLKTKKQIRKKKSVINKDEYVKKLKIHEDK